MTKDQAETAVAGSALIVGGIYAYRKLVEGADVATTPKPKGGKATDLIGYGTPPPVGQFITGWGFVFLLLALVAQASPNLGGSFAILVATGDVLGNGIALTDDLQGRLADKGTGTGSKPATINGVPQYDPSSGESTAAYDKRLNAYLIATGNAHADPFPIAPHTPNPLIPNNPLAGSPFK